MGKGRYDNIGEKIGKKYTPQELGIIVAQAMIGEQESSHDIKLTGESGNNSRGRSGGGGGGRNSRGRRNSSSRGGYQGGGGGRGRSSSSSSRGYGGGSRGSSRSSSNGPKKSYSSGSRNANR